MAYVIGEDCISCGACEAECPVSAISQGEDRYVIDPDVCVECGACAGVCPVDAPKQRGDAACPLSVSFYHGGPNWKRCSTA